MEVFLPLRLPFFPPCSICLSVPFLLRLALLYHWSLTPSFLPARQPGMSYAMEILHVCCSANGGGLRIHGPLNYTAFPYMLQSSHMRRGTFRSQLCFIADLLQIEREMTSHWLSGTTAPPLIHFVSVAVSPSV